MRPLIKTTLVIALSAGVGALLVWSFIEGRKESATEAEREQPIKAPLRVATQGGESVITLDQATRKKSGIAVTLLKAVRHQQELRAYGTVLDLQGLSDLRDGFAAAKAQMEKARAGLEASRREYERLKVLEQNRNVSAKIFQAAEATWRSDQAAARAAETAVRVLEGKVRQRWGGVLGRWLFHGSKEFERLMGRQDVLLQITLPSDFSFASAPRGARVETPQGKLASATFVSPSPRTDPRIQGVSLFYLAHAQGTRLLPGMNLLAYLPNGSRMEGVVVPASAVVWWQGKAWVYRQKASDRFIRQEISTEMPVKGGWFVTKALSAGDRVVMTGAQLLLSEEFRSQIRISD